MPAHSALGKEAANDPPKGEKAVIEDKAGLELLKTKQDIDKHIVYSECLCIYSHAYMRLLYIYIYIYTYIFIYQHHSSTQV